MFLCVFFVFFGDFYTIQIDFLDTQIGDLGTQKVVLDGKKWLFWMGFFSCGWSLDSRLFVSDNRRNVLDSCHFGFG